MTDDLYNALANFKKRDVDTFVATITEVKRESATCTVSDGDIEYSDVQLSAIVDNDNQKLIVYPALKSTVLVSPISEDIHRLYVDKYSQVESVELNIENTEFVINKDGYSLNREGENLNAVIEDFFTEFGKLCDEINKVVVSVGTTVNVAAVEEIKNNVKTSIKQRLNKVLK